MVQSSSSSGQSGMPPYVHAIDTKVILRTAIWLAAFGALAYWMLEEISEQDKNLDASRKQTEQVKDQTEKLAETVDERNKQQKATIEELQQRLESVTRDFETIGKEINTRRLTITLASINARRFIERIDELNDSIDALGKQRTQWQKDSEELLENDRGRLGSSLDFVEAFVDLKRMPLTPDDKLRTWKDDLKRLKAGLIPMRDETADEIAEVPSELEGTIAEIQQTVRAETNRLSSTQDMLKQLTENASPTLPEDATPLSQAIAQREDELKKKREVAIQAATQDVRNALTQELVAERIKTENLLAEKAREYELQVRQAKLDKQKSEKEIEIQQLADAKEDALLAEALRQADRRDGIEEMNDRRKLEAAMPEIEKYLAPFITPGNQQLNGNEWSFGATKTPLSYSAMQAFGAIYRTNDGYSALCYLAGCKENDRPNGVFRVCLEPRSINNHTELRNVEQAQELLIKYGDLMVRYGVLLK